MFSPTFTTAGKYVTGGIVRYPYLIYPQVIYVLWEMSGSCRSLQCACCQTYFVCFCHKEDIHMQTFKVLELLFSPILSLLFLVWAHWHWAGVQNVYRLILTFQYPWLHICLWVYFMAMVHQPHTSFKPIPPNSATYEMHVWVCSKGSVKWLYISRLECYRNII